MDRHLTDERLDRLFARYLAERHEEIVAMARPSAAAARTERVSRIAVDTPRTAVPIGGSRRQILMAALLAVLFAALVAGGALVGSELLRSARDPLAGLVTEPVAPGVVRIVSDDAGHEFASLGVVEVAVGADGAVWMNGRSGLFRLRQTGVADSELGRIPSTGLTVGPDGSVWSRGPWERRDRSVRSFDGERWIYHPGPTVGEGRLGNHQLAPSFAIGPDGSVWGAWDSGGLAQPHNFELARLEGGRWVSADLTGWPDDLVGNANSAYGPGLVATDDGSLWLNAHDREFRPAGLVRFDGRAWDVITIPPRVSGVQQLAAGPDGSLWVFGIDGESMAMARYADGAWTVVETPPGIRPGVYLHIDVALRPVVTPDGAVWIGRKGNTEALSQTGCDGLLRYDGTWTGYLADRCVHSVAAGPGGEAWVVAGPIDDQSGWPTQTEVYVIDPGSSAASG